MAGNKGSGRPNTILNHPDKNSIIRSIIERELGVPGAPSFAKTAKRVGLNPATIDRFRKDHITEEMRRHVAGQIKIEPIDETTQFLNQERLDVGSSYESLARRVEKLITKAEEAGDDGFALAAMDGLRKVLKDIATMHGKMATSLSVSVTLAESPEWVTMKSILRAVCDEVPEAQPVLLKHMRQHVLSVTKEEAVL
ncbi:hypothetical protein KO498_10115 [Lentibacter algarum]|uniref:hypothetical protein n=1 Tax=Lentibacter algarum TaxID=576131 RepID=UPI001C0765FC|nr:hypothetical protein [Lentibacter algarum]MBU2982165.1 hypothetical protein [Lentibacter algarum]